MLFKLNISLYMVYFIGCTIKQKSNERLKEQQDKKAIQLDLEIQNILDEAMMVFKKLIEILNNPNRRKSEHVNKIWTIFSKSRMRVMRIIKVQFLPYQIYLFIFIVKHNMQKALALQIQEITQELRMQQKNLLENLNKFQSHKKNAFDFQIESEYTQNNSKHLGQFETQLKVENYELENIESIAVDRNEKIDRLVKSINQLNELFKQMNRLVIEQGTILDRIDFNIDCTFQKTIKAKEELTKVNWIYENLILGVFYKRRETLKKAQGQAIASFFWLF